MTTKASLAERLSALEQVNDPMLGIVSPAEMAERGLLWPSERWAEIETISVAEASGRRLEEYLFTPADGTESLPAGIKVLPVSIVYDGNCARIYSAHELVSFRAPILAVAPELYPVGDDGFLGGYFNCLHRADLEGTLACFEVDGYMQHSNGRRYPAPDRLREDFVGMFANNGGKINVSFANVLDDGRVRAFECYMPSGRPAVAAYQRGPTGKIAAIRICL
jgi:hypothetical protein